MKFLSSCALILTLLAPAISSAAPVPSTTPSPVESSVIAQGYESASLRVLEATAAQVVLELTTAGYHMEPVETPQGVFARPVVDGLLSMRSPGLPQLPQHSALVAVPPGAGVRLEIAATDGQVTAATDPLLPAPRAVLPRDVASSVTEALQVSDEPVGTIDVYDTTPLESVPGGVFPRAVAELGEPAVLRGYQVVPVRLFPLQADLAGDTLILHKTVRVTVHFDYPDGMTAPAGDSTSDPYYEPVLRQSIVNFDQARAWRQAPPDAPALPAAPQAGDFKLVVDADGLYRVTYADLVAAGLDPSGVNPQQFALSQRGNPVAIYVAGEGDGRFDPGDYVEFYGLAWQSEYTNHNAYWLRLTGPASPRMATRNAAPAGAPLAISFRTTVRAEKEMLRWTQHLQDNRAWWWEKYTLYDSTIQQVTATHPIEIPGVATQTQPIGVRVAMASNTDYNQNPDHHALFFLNDPTTPLTEAIWEGRTPIEVTMTADPGSLLPDTNNLILRAMFDMGTPFAYDIYYLDWVEVTYDRLLLAQNNQLHYSKETAGTWRFSIDGFSGPARAFDVTNPASPVRLLNGQMSGSRLTVQDTVTPDRRFFAVADAAVRTPLQVQRFVPPPFNLRATSQRADYLIIAHTSFLNATQPLAALHASQGMVVKTLDVVWLYDEFNWGIPEPDAIRGFLDYAYHYWSAPGPSFVLLVGDSTFNPKGYNPAVYGPVETVYVPSFILNEDPYTGEVASDNHLVTIDGNDILADMFVGRLAAQSVADVQAMVAKNLSYAQASPVAPWRQRMLFVADNYRSANGAPDPAGNFERSIQDVIDQTGIDRFEIRRAYFDPYPNDDNGEAWRYRTVDATRTGIATEWNDGGATMNYVGHAFIDKWGEDLWRNQDAGLLTANTRLPVAITMGCLDGYFDWPNRPSLAETFNRLPGAGTIAHWSPTGLGVATGHDVLHREFYRALQADPFRTLAVATETAKVELYAEGHSPDLIHTFMIFGDPALRVGLRSQVFMPFSER